MTERERQLIEAYLMGPRDPSLGIDEYYMKDTADRVRKVYVTDLYPDKYYDWTFGVHEVGTHRRINSGDPHFDGSYNKGKLYDNKDDCKHGVHDWYDYWEHLRELQMKEATCQS